MDKLRQYIQDNRDSFDNLPLPEGHKERFEKKRIALSRKKRTGFYQLIYGTIMAAAIIALLFALNFSPSAPRSIPQGRALGCIDDEERQELLQYYHMQMNEVVTQMEIICKRDKSTGSSDLLAESRKVVKESDLFEKEELPNLPCSDKGTFVINQYYTGHVKSLHIMLRQMKRMRSK